MSQSVNAEVSDSNASLALENSMPTWDRKTETKLSQSDTAYNQLRWVW